MLNTHLSKCNSIACAIVLALMPLSSFSVPLAFSQLPPGKTAIPPAPNVVVTVDDSGSMGTKVGDGDNQTRMFRLKEALTNVFNDQVLIPYGKIRLAWQSMNNAKNNSNGATNIVAGGINAMKPFDAAHQANFNKFINSLTASGGTPSHKTLMNVYKYMTVGQTVNSPWAFSPGKTESPYLACRRAYHIFMTDGGWNAYQTYYSPGDSSVTTTMFPTGNTDWPDKNFTLPDGIDLDGNTVLGNVYDINSDQTKVYRGKTKSKNIANTLSDWAMKMWAEDLQPNIPNKIIPSTRDGVPSIETYGNVNLDRYWNPKHNPARWQHLVTYSIGYGTGAYDWGGSPDWSPTDDNYGADGDFSNLVQGLIDWKPTSLPATGSTSEFPNNRADLWHMALNSRGKFYPTGPGRKYDLAQAFRLILEDINLQNAADVTSMAANSSTNIRTDLSQYFAGYDPKAWSGYIKSDLIATDGSTSPDPSWGLTGGGNNITTANKLDSRNYSTRVIITVDDNLSKGVPFAWTNLSTNQKSLLNGGNLGQDRVKFLSGDRSKEGDGATSKPFRIRNSIQGDIVNSNIWYVEHPGENYSLPGYSSFRSTHRSRTPIIYVGSNDGMLHGFSANNGEEVIAYVPKSAYTDLSKLSDPDYKHRYFVDGSPLSGDVDISDKASASPNDWRTLLVGTLGAGGKGYFVLDITDPANFTSGNAENLVVMDRTLHASQSVTAGSDDADIGHIFAAPVLDDNNPYKTNQITRLNDKRWAVIMGNGYNSKNERPVLLIQYLDGLKELKKIVATGAQVPHTPVNPSLDANVVANGLSAPRLVDLDGNGTADIVYAGDIKGNLWKFDLTDVVPGNWGVARFGGTAQPLFTASYAGKRQPIAAPPSVRANDRGAGGMMVAFGTGLNVTDADRTSTDVQSVYSILDNTVYRFTGTGPGVHLEVDPAAPVPATIAGLSDLVEQKFDTSPTGGIAGGGVSAGRTFWKMQNNPVDFTGTVTGTAQKGWYFHLQVSGERVLNTMSFFDRSNILMINSITPAYGGSNTNEESCEPSGTPAKAYLTLMNIMDGRKPSVQIMDVNGDGLYVAGSGSGGAGQPPGDKDASRMTIQPGALGSVVGKKTIRQCGGGDSAQCDDLARMPEQPMRPSWRQLQ